MRLTFVAAINAQAVPKTLSDFLLSHGSDVRNMTRLECPLGSSDRLGRLL